MIEFDEEAKLFMVKSWGYRATLDDLQIEEWCALED